MLRVILLALAVALPAFAQAPPDYVLVGDPGNPDNPEEVNITGATGECKDGMGVGNGEICQSLANCQTPPYTVSCDKPGWPAEHQFRGAVGENFFIKEKPITVEEWVEFLNATSLVVIDPILTNMLSGNGDPDDLMTNPTPPLVTGTTGNYVALPAAKRLPIMLGHRDYYAMYINWLENGKGSTYLTGTYTCGTGPFDPEGQCDMTPDPNSRYRLPTGDQWMKATYWDWEHQAWCAWPGIPKSGGTCNTEPKVGIDLNTASIRTGFNCRNGLNDPTAPCEYVSVDEYPHYKSRSGMLQGCGNGMDTSQDCGELLGVTSCTRMIAESIHPFLTAQDCLPNHVQQTTLFSASEIPLDTVAPKLRPVITALPTATVGSGTPYTPGRSLWPRQ